MLTTFVALWSSPVFFTLRTYKQWIQLRMQYWIEPCILYIQKILMRWIAGVEARGIRRLMAMISYQVNWKVEDDFASIKTTEWIIKYITICCFIFMSVEVSFLYQFTWHIIFVLKDLHQCFPSNSPPKSEMNRGFWPYTRYNEFWNWEPSFCYVKRIFHRNSEKFLNLQGAFLDAGWFASRTDLQEVFLYIAIEITWIMIVRIFFVYFNCTSFRQPISIFACEFLKRQKHNMYKIGMNFKTCGRSAHGKLRIKIRAHVIYSQNKCLHSINIICDL